MGNSLLSGTLVAGPPTSCSSQFPGGLLSYPIQNGGCCGAGFQAATGVLSRTVAAAVYTDLGEPGHSVTKATFFYFKSNAPVTLRLTRDDGQCGNIISTEDVFGMLVLEFPATKFLKKLELLGNATIEYFLAGNE